MKKALLIASALVISFGFSSCKKDFVCTCIDDATGESYDTPISNTTRPLASTSCKAFELTGETCSLK